MQRIVCIHICFTPIIDVAVTVLKVASRRTAAKHTLPFDAQPLALVVVNILVAANSATPAVFVVGEEVHVAGELGRRARRVRERTRRHRAHLDILGQRGVGRRVRGPGELNGTGVGGCFDERVVALRATEDDGSGRQYGDTSGRDSHGSPRRTFESVRDAR